MPTLMELRSRFGKERDSQAGLNYVDEALVADVRGRLTPAQVVEQKLRTLLLKPKSSGSAQPARPFRGAS